MSLFDFETMISPGFLVGEGREAVIVPIKEAYAAQLLPAAARQQSLFPSREALLYLEKAYFSGSATKGTFLTGTPVVFYVSGAERGRQEAIGLARVTFTDQMTVTQAKINLARQGVLSEEELSAFAGPSGKLTAFTFDNFVTFPTQVSFHQLKQLGCVSGANLVTAQRLPHQGFLKLVDVAFGGGK